eukprot:70799-Rhodomonas_salina.1
MYWSGSGVQQDHAQAAMWFKEAASQVHDPPQTVPKHWYPFEEFCALDPEMRVTQTGTAGDTTCPASGACCRVLRVSSEGVSTEG